MEAISTQDIELLTEIANRLPGKQGNQLLGLIDSWAKNARKSPRSQYNEHVRFSSDGKSHGGKAKDLSTAGIFIEGKDSFTIGDQVKIMLNVSLSPAPAEISGTVVRHTTDGVGIRFNYENSEDKDLIDDLIQSKSSD